MRGAIDELMNRTTGERHARHAVINFHQVRFSAFGPRALFLISLRLRSGRHGSASDRVSSSPGEERRRHGGSLAAVPARRVARGSTVASGALQGGRTLRSAVSHVFRRDVGRCADATEPQRRRVCTTSFANRAATDARDEFADGSARKLGRRVFRALSEEAPALVARRGVPLPSAPGFFFL